MMYCPLCSNGVHPQRLYGPNENIDGAPALTMVRCAASVAHLDVVGWDHIRLAYIVRDRDNGSIRPWNPFRVFEDALVLSDAAGIPVSLDYENNCFRVHGRVYSISNNLNWQHHAGAVIVGEAAAVGWRQW